MSEIVIETKQLTKQYGTQKSVSELNIHVQRGRIYGLLGRNGAGKTTTMKMLLGLTQPTSGKVTIWGKPLLGNQGVLRKELFIPVGQAHQLQGAFDCVLVFQSPQGSENAQVLRSRQGCILTPQRR